jgi:hypothetical protein
MIVSEQATALRNADPEAWFHRLATHYVEAQIYFHLNQCGVFQQIAGGECTSPAIAEKLDLDPRILDILLDYAAHIGDLICRTVENRYELTQFGHQVLSRYGKVNGNRTIYNMFDVRIGAWGPVWANLGSLLNRSAVYGKDIHRAGQFAAEGLFKLAVPLTPAVEKTINRLEAQTIVEIGPTSGILAQLAERDPSRHYIGVDINPQSLIDAKRLAEERGIECIQWIHGDLFKPAEFLDRLPREGRALLFSCYFHEFLAGGADPVTRSLRSITRHPTVAGVLALEQPRLEGAGRNEYSTTQWLYAHSNVLIHHLIKNAKILTDEEWTGLLMEGGCSAVDVQPTRGFGFNAYVGTVHQRGSE